MLRKKTNFPTKRRKKTLVINRHSHKWGLCTQLEAYMKSDTPKEYTTFTESLLRRRTFANTFFFSYQKRMKNLKKGKQGWRKRNQNIGSWRRSRNQFFLRKASRQSEYSVCVWNDGVHVCIGTNILTQDNVNVWSHIHTHTHCTIRLKEIRWDKDSAKEFFLKENFLQFSKQKWNFNCWCELKWFFNDLFYHFGFGVCWTICERVRVFTLKYVWCVCVCTCICVWVSVRPPDTQLAIHFFCFFFFFFSVSRKNVYSRKIHVFFLLKYLFEDRPKKKK